MIISKDSWHYRLLNFFNMLPYELIYSHKCNLCPYFRTVIASTIYAFMLLAIIAVLLFFMATSVMYIFGYHVFNERLPMVGFICMGVLLLSFILFKYGEIMAEKLIYFLDERRDKKDKPKNRKPSLFKARIKAMHDKVCPEITLEE